MNETCTVTVTGLPADALVHADEGKFQQKSDNDVFCLIKEFMADQDLSQRPFKAVPATFHADCTQALDTLATAAGHC